MSSWPTCSGLSLRVWPDWIPVKCRPTRQASSRAWVVVLMLFLYILAEKSGVLEALPSCIPQPCTQGQQLHDFVGAAPLIGSAATRALGSAMVNTTAGSSTGSAGHSSSGEGGHGATQHHALLFMFNAFVLGTITTHLMNFELFKSLQQSVVLFVLGAVYSFISEALIMSGHFDDLGALGNSYNMWMEIDPHLILFTLLPSLLTGDAMTLDTAVARRVAKQCIYLASVGVVVNAFLAAAFLYFVLPYDWSFLLCLTTGSILCATDPVAVVALLKELGASPTLTVLIQGESLLNDGTAIVLYSISYEMLMGAKYDVADIVMILVKQCMCAAGLGMIVGVFFLAWIWMARNRFESHNVVIQVSLTICCAYWSFIIAEGVFHISGVIATVTAALVLANAMWPYVVDKESMHTFWHMLEYLGNTLIFFLAGALTGKVMVKIPAIDYLYLIAIYVAVSVIRFVMLLASKPILKQLSEDAREVTMAEVVVMTWGGLRGAVGLALAIQVTVDRADGNLSELNAMRVLFFVGGVAALTLVLNASTCPTLVNGLGLTQLPETKRRLLFMLRRRMMELCKDQNQTTRVQNILKPMMDAMDNRLDEEKQWIVMEAGDTSSRNGRTSTRSGNSDFGERTSMSSRASVRLSAGAAKLKEIFQYRNWNSTVVTVEDNLGMLEELVNMRKMFTEFPLSDKDPICKQLSIEEHAYPSSMFNHDQAELLEDIMKSSIDYDMQCAINDAFLCIVRSLYWHDIEHGIIKSGTVEADVLMGSIDAAMGMQDLAWQREFGDWSYVLACVEASLVNEPEEHKKRASGRRSQMNKKKSESQRRISDRLNASQRGTDLPSTAWQSEGRSGIDRLHSRTSFRLVNSSPFIGLIMVSILINALAIFAEEEFRNSDNDDHAFWSVSDILFNVIFTTECILKLAAYRKLYFLSSWNLFDLVLVLSGLFGMCMNYIAQADKKASSNTGALRIARVFRVLRLVRMARLLKFLQVFKNRYFADQMSAEMREHLQKVHILKCFALAHMRAQPKLFAYFGTTTDVATVEVARCVVLSEVSVYKAIFQCIEEEQSLSTEMLFEVRQVRTTKLIAGELETFIMEAHQSGIIDASDAKSIVHPLREYMEKNCTNMIRMGAGSMDEATQSEADKTMFAKLMRSASTLGRPASPHKSGPLASAWSGENSDDRRASTTSILSSETFDSRRQIPRPYKKLHKSNSILSVSGASGVSQPTESKRIGSPTGSQDGRSGGAGERARSPDSGQGETSTSSPETIVEEVAMQLSPSQQSGT